MARTRDPAVDRAIEAATLRLLSTAGFAGMTVEAVAAEAGVGKPAIYRRHADKPSLVAAAVRTQLPSLEVPDLGDTRAELVAAM
jgi:AcrR family transcriptional regulator